MGLAHSTISLTVIEQAPAGAEGAASASMQLAYVLGVALGAGLGGAAVALVERGALSPTTGFAAAFGIMVLVALATAVLARRLPAGRARDRRRGRRLVTAHERCTHKSRKGLAGEQSRKSARPGICPTSMVWPRPPILRPTSSTVFTRTTRGIG